VRTGTRSFARKANAADFKITNTVRVARTVLGVEFVFWIVFPEIGHIIPETFAVFFHQQQMRLDLLGLLAELLHPFLLFNLDLLDFVLFIVPLAEKLVVGLFADDPVLDISQHLFVLLRVPIVIFVPGERLPGRLRKPLIYELLDPVVLLDELLFLILVN
jgi:hypothetical protein